MSSQTRFLGSSKGKNPLALPSPSSKLYNPNAQFICPRRDLEERRRAIGATKRVVESLGVSLPTLDEFNIKGTILDLFEHAKLDFAVVMGNRTYHELVKDFIGTLEFQTDGSTVIAWKFWCQGEFYKFEKEYAIEHFGFGRNGCVPNYLEGDRVDFWRFLTGMDYYNAKCAPKCIRFGEWKYIHRLVAVNFNPRNDEGSHVTREDLDIMLALYHGDEIDWFQLFSHRFIKMFDLETKNKAIGCASLITAIGKAIGFDFNDEDGTYRVLNTSSLIHMRLIDRKTKLWIHDPFLPMSAQPKGRIPQGPLMVKPLQMVSAPEWEDEAQEEPIERDEQMPYEGDHSTVAKRVRSRRRVKSGSSKKAQGNEIVEVVELEDSD